jgi:hypothetical protein
MGAGEANPFALKSNTTTNRNNKMPKLKRVSESQLNKDAYEAEQDDDRFAVQPDPGRGMTRASEDVMQRRKIVKVSR